MLQLPLPSFNARKYYVLQLPLPSFNDRKYVLHLPLPSFNDRKIVILVKSYNEYSFVMNNIFSLLGGLKWK